MIQHILIATLAIAAFALSNTASAEICKYIDTDGNLHFTNAPPERGWKLIFCGVGDRTSTKTAPKTIKSADAPTLTYPDVISSTFEREDEPSAKNGFKKCEIVVTMTKGGEGVYFRAKVLTDGKLTMTTLTIDVAEFTVSNGIPYDPKKKPISGARIASNIFETTQAMRQVDMADGGWGIMLDQTGFSSMTKLIVRGDYLVGFKRRDRPTETLYAVREGVKKDVLGQFRSCIEHL